ncbi:unnamed protein product [Caenorhabditis bovis]|uniref:Uncharacterized protein n=1 Tax=Caenorhabditis bovis TaxID=2654633 RepID=A0A8S1FC41_9PELO|nr:unnamed protein product [Caenorhabditis bovis]
MLKSYWVCVVVALCALLMGSVSAQQKRSSMGGSAFGSLDRIPLSYLKKFYGIPKNAKRDPSDFDKYMGYRDDYY